MAGSNGGDPADLFAKGLSFMQEAIKVFGKEASGELKSEWSQVTDKVKEATAPKEKSPSPSEQRENLAFGLAERAVTALEDISLNTAAIRQRLERNAEPRAGKDSAIDLD